LAEFKEVSEGRSWNYHRQSWTLILGFCRCSKTHRGERVQDGGFGSV